MSLLDAAGKPTSSKSRTAVRFEVVHQRAGAAVERIAVLNAEVDEGMTPEGAHRVLHVAADAVLRQLRTLGVLKVPTPAASGSNGPSGSKKPHPSPLN